MRFVGLPEDDVAHMIGCYAYRRPSYGETTCLSPFDASLPFLSSAGGLPRAAGVLATPVRDFLAALLGYGGCGR